MTEQYITKNQLIILLNRQCDSWKIRADKETGDTQKYVSIKIALAFSNLARELSSYE